MKLLCSARSGEAQFSEIMKKIHFCGVNKRVGKISESDIVISIRVDERGLDLEVLRRQRERENEEGFE